ncbi:hypothetical protein P43SY_003642 [Pythium insidiosum]|uniref:Secreted protein n=1 Tax=Pythium insidiosum TaxID=114742 RepID=A0AAD5QB89_PYTIN|nr:hypothetical protein P43SY_003642 [Pythium insidiosum]
MMMMIMLMMMMVMVMAMMMMMVMTTTMTTKNPRVIATGAERSVAQLRLIDERASAKTDTRTTAETAEANETRMPDRTTAHRATAEHEDEPEDELELKQEPELEPERQNDGNTDSVSAIDTDTDTDADADTDADTDSRSDSASDSEVVQAFLDHETGSIASNYVHVQANEHSKNDACRLQLQLQLHLDHCHRRQPLLHPFQV